MAKTIEQIQEEVQQIKNETVAKQNTATRVGGALEDMVEKMEADSISVEGKLSNLGSKVGELPNAIDTKSEETEIVCGVGDDKGYIAFGVDKDGELHSKNFNSKDTPKTKTNISDYPLAIGDEKGNIALAVNEDGEIVSQNFNSSETKKLGNVKCVEDSSDNILNIGDKDGNLIFFIDKYGNIKTHNFDSSSVKGEKKKIKILCYGNSWSCDAFSYLPALIESVLGKDNVEIQFGIMYIGGCTLQTHYERMTQPTSGDYGFNLWLTKNGKWTTEQQPFGYPLQNYTWDIVLFQQQSSNARNYTSYQPYLNGLIDGIYDMVQYPIKFGWNLTPPYPTGYSGLKGDTSLSMFEKIATSAQRVINETAIETVIPFGTAIINAMSTSLDSLGDFGHLFYEGLHLQEGIPCILESYVSALKIFEIYGISQNSVFNSKIRPTEAWIAFINGLQRHGTSVGVTESNILLAQKVAIMAYKKPFEKTDCGALFE